MARHPKQKYKYVQKQDGDCVVIVANSETERDNWVTALRVRVAPWRVLAERACEVVGSSGRSSGIVRDAGRRIYDQIALKQPLGAKSTRVERAMELICQ